LSPLRQRPPGRRGETRRVAVDGRQKQRITGHDPDGYGTLTGLFAAEGVVAMPIAPNATAIGQASVIVMADVAKDSVSPELVVLFADRFPHHRRIGVPALSHSSIPTTVTAGMLVKVTAPSCW